MSSGRHSLLSHRKKRIAQRNAVVTVFVRRGSQSATRLHIRRLSELRPPTIRRSTSSVGGGFVAVDVIAAVVRILLLLRLRTTKNCGGIVVPLQLLPSSVVVSILIPAAVAVAGDISVGVAAWANIAIHRYPPPPPPPLYPSSSQSSIHGLREVVVSDVIAPPTLVVVNGSRPSVPLNVVDQHSTLSPRVKLADSRKRMKNGRRHRPRTPIRISLVIIRQADVCVVLMSVHVDLPTLEQYMSYVPLNIKRFKINKTA